MRHIPIVKYKDTDYEGMVDLYSGLLRNGVIFLTDEIDDDVANLLIAKLIYLEKEGYKEVTIYINSPGGSVLAGMAIYDAMKNLKIKANMVCFGHAMSMAAILLACGQKGRRAAYKNAGIMFHQPSTSFEGKFTDVRTSYEHLRSIYENINKIIIEHTKITAVDIENMHSDWYMSPEKALEYGVIDYIEGQDTLPQPTIGDTITQ